MSTQRAPELQIIWEATGGRWQPHFDSAACEYSAQRGWVRVTGWKVEDVIRRARMAEDMAPGLLLAADLGQSTRLVVYAEPSGGNL